MKERAGGGRTSGDKRRDAGGHADHTDHSECTPPGLAHGPTIRTPLHAQRLQMAAGNRAVAAVLAPTVQRESAPREPDEEDKERATVQTLSLQQPAPARAPLAVQRVNDFTVTGLTVAGATAVVGAADTFVAPRGSTVTTTATVVSASGAALPPRTVRWSAGRAGADQLNRVVSGGARRVVLTVRVGSSSRRVTIFIANAPVLPAPVPAATLEHRKIGRSNPGTDFGLTVVTIGSQGVRGPRFEVNAFLSGAQWRFGVHRIRHGYKVGVASQGRRDIPNAAAVPPRLAGQVITDLTPPVTASGPPRARFWVRTFTVAHEQAHVDHFYLPAHGFWPPTMRTFEAGVTAGSVNFHPTTARSPSQVLRAQEAGWRTAIDAQHSSADAAEIPSSETFAHGVSNPMYTALIANIRATVRPPAPTNLAAAATGPTSVVLTWTQDATLATSLVLERRAAGGPWVPIAPALAAASVAFTDAAATAGTRYTYRLSAVGPAGASPRTTARVRTP